MHLSWLFPDFPHTEPEHGHLHRTNHPQCVEQVTIRLLGWCPGTLRRSVTLCLLAPLEKFKTTSHSSANSSIPNFFGNQAAHKFGAAMSHTISSYNWNSQVPLLGQSVSAWTMCRIGCCSFRLRKWQMPTGLLKSCSVSGQTASLLNHGSPDWWGLVVKALYGQVLLTSLLSEPYIYLTSTHWTQNAVLSVRGGWGGIIRKELKMVLLLGYEKE